MSSAESQKSTRKQQSSALREDGPAFAPISRRQLLLRSLTACGTVALGEGVLAEASPKVTRHTVRLAGLKEPLRVVQLTDLHRSWSVSEPYLQRVIAQANALHPDLALLTGDFVTHSSGYMESCLRPLQNLKTRLGSYAVLGNHDYSCDRKRGAPRIVEALESIHVEVLTNRNLRLDSGLRLVGIDEYSCGRPDPELAFRGTRKDEPILAMTHNPLLFPFLTQYDCLTVVGHTHGGQIYIPFVTRHIFTEIGRYMRGWFRSDKGPGRMYVCRGLGVVGIPLRVHCDPEIAVFELEPA